MNVVVRIVSEGRTLSEGTLKSRMWSWKIDSVHSMIGLRCEPKSGAGGAEGVGFGIILK